MAVIIGHATIDERGKTTGGIAGDQSGQELATRKWYNKGWTKVFRAYSPEVAEKIAVAMEQACANDNIGYDKNERLTLFEQAKKHKWDLSKIDTPCETDDVALVMVCVNAAGARLFENVTITNFEAYLNRNAKFKTLTDKTYLTETGLLKRGDILYAPTHMAVVLSDGNLIEKPKFDKPIGKLTVEKKGHAYYGPGEKRYSVAGSFEMGEAFDVVEATLDWYKVIWRNEKYAYIKDSDVSYKSYTISKAIKNYKVIVPAGEHIYELPQENAKIISTLKRDSKYIIVKEAFGYGLIASGLGWVKLP